MRAGWIVKAFIYFFLVSLYLPIIYLIYRALSIEIVLKVFADQDLLDSMGRSLYISTTSSFIAVVMGLMTAVWIHSYPGQFAKWLYGCSQVSLVLPEIVLGLSLLSFFFLLAVPLGFFTVIFAHSILTLSYVVLVLLARLNNLDPELERAAWDLGASRRRTFWTVIFPQLRSSLLGAYILAFLVSFDDFVLTYFVNGAGMDTFPVKLFSSLKQGMSPQMMAASGLLVIASLGVISIAQKLGAFRPST